MKLVQPISRDEIRDLLESRAASLDMDAEAASSKFIRAVYQAQAGALREFGLSLGR